VVEVQSEDPKPEDIGDNLWQTWLGRLGSVLAARAKRRTLVPKEEIPLEIEPTLRPIEPEPKEEIPSLPQENSLEILRNIGRDLRERRELLSLHFEEVERNTHVKAHYLEALERGALDDLPSTVQTRGMLSNYATFLDLDVDAILLRFADALQARHRERNPHNAGPQTGSAHYCQYAPGTGLYCRRYDLRCEHCYLARGICNLGSEPGDDSPESAGRQTNRAVDF
jgi:transcriptional regulator with XRE-family HTH domain